MAETFRYRPSDTGWAKIANSSEMQALTRRVAERGKQYAQSISPESGDGVDVPYKESFEVETVTVKDFGRKGSTRAGAVLRNTARHAAAVEWGNKHTPKAQRVFGRTLDYLGRSK